MRILPNKSTCTSIAAAMASPSIRSRAASVAASLRKRSRSMIQPFDAPFPESSLALRRVPPFDSRNGRPKLRNT